MMIVQPKIIAPFFVAVALVTALVGGVITQPAAAQQKLEVQYLRSAEATAENITVTTVGSSIRVEFDYSLRGSATTAYVDAALNNQRSFNPVEVTGPGHYDQTLTDLDNGEYAIYIVISGNPNYLLGDPDPSNQPLILTLPSSSTTSENSDFVKSTRKAFHTQHEFFKEKKV